MVPGAAMQTVVTPSIGTSPSHARSFASNLPDSTVYGGPSASPSAAATDKGERTRPSPTSRPYALRSAPIHRAFASDPPGVMEIRIPNPNVSQLPPSGAQAPLGCEAKRGNGPFVSDGLSLYPDTDPMACTTPADPTRTIPHSVGVGRRVCRKPRDAALAARKVRRGHQAQHAHRLRLPLRRSRTSKQCSPLQTAVAPRPCHAAHNRVSVHSSTVSTARFRAMNNSDASSNPDSFLRWSC